MSKSRRTSARGVNMNTSSDHAPNHPSSVTPVEVLGTRGPAATAPLRATRMSETKKLLVGIALLASPFLAAYLWSAWRDAQLAPARATYAEVSRLLRLA